MTDLSRSLSTGHVLELVLYSRSRQNFPNIPIFLNDSFLLSSTRRGERKECETVSRNSFQQEAYLATNFIILSFYAGLFDDRNRVISMRDLYLLSTFLNIFSFIHCFVVAKSVAFALTII